jgi:hypothetical protein
MEREGGGGAILGLDTDEPADDVDGCGRWRIREALGAEAMAADRVGRQGTAREDLARP